MIILVVVILFLGTVDHKMIAVVVVVACGITLVLQVANKTAFSFVGTQVGGFLLCLVNLFIDAPVPQGSSCLYVS